MFILQKRFIFIMWKWTLDNLKIFVVQLNKLVPPIKFSVKYSRTSIEFLNTRIYNSANGKLQTTFYTKPTDRQILLRQQILPPSSCKRSIAYSQALLVLRKKDYLNLRIRQISTEDSKYFKHTDTYS